MDRSLLEHLRIDRNYFPRSINLLELLQETSGYVPSIEKIVNRAWNSLDKQFIQKKGWQWIDLKGSWLGGGCRLHILRRSLKDVPSSVQGEAELEVASLDSQDRVQNVEIIYYIDEDRKVDDKEFKNTLHHELTHVYEFLQRSKRMRDLDKQGNSGKLEKIQDSSVRHEVLSKIGAAVGEQEGFQRSLYLRIYACLYMCSPLEQNAFIAQIKSELEGRVDELSNFRKAAEIVEQTAAWNNLKGAKAALRGLSNLSKERNKATVVRWAHAYFGNISTFNQAIKRISYELDRFERKLKNRLGKMCGELYQNSEEYLKEWRSSWTSLPKPTY